MAPPHLWKYRIRRGGMTQTRVRMEGGDVTQLDILQQEQWHRLIPENIGFEEGTYCRPELA
jgi:hypothetical protein